MGHVPRYASSHTIDVPDEEAARQVARLLVERGHSVVRMPAPGPSGGPLSGKGWRRVHSIDEGPYPDDDESWWRAVEQQAVAKIADAYGGSHMTGVAHAETLRSFVAEGETIADRTVEQVRDLRLAALSGEPARAPAPVIVHGLDTPEPVGDRFGVPIELDGLDDVDWAALGHAYGADDSVPAILRGLAANDEGWKEAQFEYFSAVVHQDTCYATTPPTIGFLTRLALAPQLNPPYRLELLIDFVYLATIDPGPASGEPVGEDSSDEALTCQAVIDHLPQVLSLWPDGTPPLRAWLTVLAALDPAAATALLPGMRDFRRRVEGPSPALDLALALLTGDDDAALDLTAEAAARDERVSDLLEHPLPLRARHLKVLFHLALEELAPKTRGGGH
ncbi:hypothetical protein ABZ801_39535 [Actinomadura sp. NPDC047616]|uniref:hypothetical protein n=1 Tax=Actinomadura sp. NPDC047616 TaxID=3155914 RepID=UPI0033D8F22D